MNGTSGLANGDACWEHRVYRLGNAGRGALLRSSLNNGFLLAQSPNVAILFFAGIFVEEGLAKEITSSSFDVVQGDTSAWLLAEKHLLSREQEH